MTAIEMLKQEVKETLEFCHGKEFCAIETKILKGLLDEIDRLTIEGEKAELLLKRISEIIDRDDGVYRIAGIEREIIKYQKNKA